MPLLFEFSINRFSHDVAHIQNSSNKHLRNKFHFSDTRRCMYGTHVKQVTPKGHHINFAREPLRSHLY